MSALGKGDGTCIRGRLVPEPEYGIGPIGIEGIQQWHAFDGDFAYGFRITGIDDDDSRENFRRLLRLYSGKSGGRSDNSQP